MRTGSLKSPLSRTSYQTVYPLSIWWYFNYWVQYRIGKCFSTWECGRARVWEREGLLYVDGLPLCDCFVAGGDVCVGKADVSVGRKPGPVFPMARERPAGDSSQARSTPTAHRHHRRLVWIINIDTCMNILRALGDDAVLSCKVKQWHTHKQPHLLSSDIITPWWHFSPWLKSPRSISGHLSGIGHLWKPPRQLSTLHPFSTPPFLICQEEEVGYTLIVLICSV